MRKVYLTVAGIVTVLILGYGLKNGDFKPQSEASRRIELHAAIGNNLKTACDEWINGSKLKGNQAFRNAVRLGHNIDGSEMDKISAFTRILNVYTRKYTKEQQQLIRHHASRISYR